MTGYFLSLAFCDNPSRLDGRGLERSHIIVPGGHFKHTRPFTSRYEGTSRPVRTLNMYGVVNLHEDIWER